MGDAKLAIVAGIGPGLSGSIAKALSAEGYKVGGLARRQENLQALETELGAENFKGIKTDLTSMSELTAAIAELEENFGPVELYIHNATGFHVGPFLETSAEDFEMVWRSGVLSAFNGGQAVLPGMVERGKGTFLVSGATASMRGGANFSAFASAKICPARLNPIPGTSIRTARRPCSPYGNRWCHLGAIGRAVWCCPRKMS